jgi:hypothetical protein
MSKVVKKVGKVIKKVVKGVVKGVKKVWKAVKQSKFLKIAAIAAAVYFGGAALLGGIGGATGGAGFIAGAKAGVASAWGGITGAGAALASGNIAGAGSSLAGGFTGAYGAGAGTVASSLAPIATATPAYTAPSAGVTTATGGAGAGAGAGAATTGNYLTGASTTAPSGFSSLGNAVGAGQATGLNAAAPGAVGGVGGATTAASLAPAVNPGLLGRAAAGIGKGWNALGPAGQFGTVMVGGQMLQGYAAAKAQEDAEAEALARYQANIGGIIQTPVYNPETGRYEVPNLYRSSALQYDQYGNAVLYGGKG